MRKSVLLQRIVLLLLSAVLLSGIVTASIYLLVTQSLMVNMQARELLPTARSIAEVVGEGSNATQLFHAGLGSRDLIRAAIYIYSANGSVTMPGPQRIVGQRIEGQGGAVQGSAVQGGAEQNERFVTVSPDRAPGDLREDIFSEMIAEDLETVLAGKEVSGVRKSEGGQSFLVIGVPVYTEREVVGAVLFSKPMEELTGAMRGLNLTLVLSTLISFCVMLVPAYFATRRLVMPIRQMRDVAHAMARGDFSLRADEGQKGEIGELGQSMNHFTVESARLEQTRRDYVANVSHELRTPIAAIRAMGETLRDGMARAPGKQDMFYNSIVRESLRLGRLVDDLLELSRLQSGAEAMQKRPFDLREPLQNAADTCLHMAEGAGISLVLGKVLEKPVIVRSNADRVEQVLVIFLDNAVRHTPEGGAITLACREWNGKAVVTVRNTGEPIPAEDLPYLFERFYKVDKSHSGGGTGLGLSIAWEVMRGLGGEMGADSGPDGTEFWFSIDLQEGKNGEK